MTRRLVMLGLAGLWSCGPMQADPMMDGGLPDAGPSMMDAGQVDAGMTVDAGAQVDAGMVASDGGVRFSVDVAPVLQVCTGCHADRATFAGVQPLVTPGDPANSPLYRRITSQGRPMPPSGPLSATDPQGTARIEAWIRAGARDD